MNGPPAYPVDILQANDNAFAFQPGNFVSDKENGLTKISNDENYFMK
jgi:hypothetical protein